MIEKVLGIILLVIAVAAFISWAHDKEKEEEEKRRAEARQRRYRITPERREKAKRIMNTIFFKKIKLELFEKLRRDDSSFYTGYPYWLVEAEGITMYKGYDNEYTNALQFFDIGYRNLRDEERLILTIALSYLTPFEYEINEEYGGVIVYKNRVKTYKELEKERKIRNLKDIY